MDNVSRDSGVAQWIFLPTMAVPMHIILIPAASLPCADHSLEHGANAQVETDNKYAPAHQIPDPATTSLACHIVFADLAAMGIRMHGTMDKETPC